MMLSNLKRLEIESRWFKRVVMELEVGRKVILRILETSQRCNLFLGKISNIPLKLEKFTDLPSHFSYLRICSYHPNFFSISMKNAPNPSKTPSIESIIENYAYDLLIASRQVLRECPVASHLPHLNARFGRSNFPSVRFRR